MDFDKEKMLKLVIITLATLAALAVMSTLIQLIQTVLPFLIVGAGVYAAYRWALSDAPAPTADEVEEQARGLFGRFRRSKKAVEKTMQVADMLTDLGGQTEERARPEESATAEKAARPAKPHRRSFRRRQEAAAAPPAKASAAQAAPEAPPPARRAEGAIEFKDQDVLISDAGVIQPDISRLEEKEKEEAEVTNNVLEQIEARRRRLREDE